MKRTLNAMICMGNGKSEYLPEPITCEVTGEMSDGTKVWTDVKTGEQYFLVRTSKSVFVRS